MAYLGHLTLLRPLAVRRNFFFVRGWIEFDYASQEAALRRGGNVAHVIASRPFVLAAFWNESLRSNN